MGQAKWPNCPAPDTGKQLRAGQSVKICKVFLIPEVQKASAVERSRLKASRGLLRIASTYGGSSKVRWSRSIGTGQENRPDGLDSREGSRVHQRGHLVSASGESIRPPNGTFAPPPQPESIGPTLQPPRLFADEPERKRTMRITRTAAASMAAITTAMGLSLATAGPAAAADPGTWVRYGNTNPITSSSSTWRCAPTKIITTNVGAQVCAVRTESRLDVQGAVIVRNNKSIDFDARATIDLFGTYSLGRWECPIDEVKPNSWSVCFGHTERHNGAVDSLGTLNGGTIGVSPMV
ncbi:hypothetical protein [Streptomyces sp. DSM 40750]|uniref:hypothetical protein n=1 Tax=Streptomyces sp. DSM 40750 TaxID=2801030 RepID=UPI00214BDC51|nr:hypothetical protein [Streptomyces sp. DSM 40750]UUU22269.1 hypothetical protein JIX55_19215 [Streptomyces sp. DSM 40750]